MNKFLPLTITLLAIFLANASAKVHVVESVRLIATGAGH